MKGKINMSCENNCINCTCNKNISKLNNAKGKLGQAKEGINNLKNLDEDASTVKTAITFAYDVRKNV